MISSIIKKLKHNKIKKEIMKFPENRRYYKNDEGLNDCVIGIPYNATIFETLKDIPPTTKQLSFYFGSDIKGLLKHVVQLDLMENIEQLNIGHSNHSNNGDNYSDYSEISNILSSVYFPNLKHFSYGVDELICNAHCCYGNLGDITQILKNMPRLEQLDLYGNFIISEEITLKNLTKIDILMDDFTTHLNGGRIPESTIENLLSSNFPALTTLYVNLEFEISCWSEILDSTYTYRIPPVFRSGDRMPNLNRLELCGKFVKGTKEYLMSSPFINDPLKTIHIDTIEEPE